MGRSSTKKKSIILSKENLLYQPLPLVLSGYEATAMQQNIVIAILRKMRDAIKEMRDNQFREEPQQLSLFTHDDVKNKFLREGDLCFDVHMRELGVEAKHYPIAFNSIYSMSDAIVYIPVEKDGRQQMLRTKLFDTIDDNVQILKDRSGRITYKYKERSPVCSVIMRKQVVEFLFPPNKRIYDFLDDTALSISEKYPKRIYMYLSSFKHIPGGVYTVDYWKFRHDIGLNDSEAKINAETGERDIQYPLFRKFVCRVLDPAKRILKELSEKNQSDFFFDVEPIYKGSRRAKNPDLLRFTFTLSDVGRQILAEKRGIKKEIELEQVLMNELSQSAAQVSVLMKRVTSENRMSFVQKVKNLCSEKERVRKKPISDICSWANASLTRFLDEAVEKAEQTEISDLFAEQHPAPSEMESHDEQEKCVVDVNVWDQFLIQLKDGVGEKEFDVWFKDVVRPFSFQEKCLVLEAPTRFVAEKYVNEFLDCITKSVRGVFGDDVTYRIKIKE